MSVEVRRIVGDRQSKICHGRAGLLQIKICVTTLVIGIRVAPVGVNGFIERIYRHLILPGCVVGLPKHKICTGIVGRIDRICLQDTDRLAALTGGDISACQGQVDRNEGQVNLVGALCRCKTNIVFTQGHLRIRQIEVGQCRIG